MSENTIGTKFVPLYACNFMDHTEKEFLKMQDIKPWFWKRFIDDIFFKWTKIEGSLEQVPVDLRKFRPNLNFTYNL